MSLALRPKDHFDKEMSVLLGVVPKQKQSEILDYIYDLAERAQSIETHRLEEGTRTLLLRRDFRIYEKLDSHFLHFLSTLKKTELSLHRGVSKTEEQAKMRLSELESAVDETRLYVKRIAELLVMEIHPDLRNKREVSLLQKKRVIVLSDLPHLRSRLAEHWFIVSLDMYLASFFPKPTNRMTLISEAIEHAFGLSDWDGDRIRHVIGRFFDTPKARTKRHRSK